MSGPFSCLEDWGQSGERAGCAKKTATFPPPFSEKMLLAEILMLGKKQLVTFYRFPASRRTIRRKHRTDNERFGIAKIKILAP